MRRHPDMRSVRDRWSVGDVSSVGLGMAIGTIVVIALAWCALKIMLPGAARAHDWYPPACCSGGDCGPLDSSRITRSGADYIVDHRWRVLRADAKPSPDGRYHGCWPDRNKPPVCFYAPPDGF